MKLAKILTALFLTVCMLTSVVSAAVIDSAVYNPDTDTITIKGQLPSEEISSDLLTHEINSSNIYGNNNAYKDENWFIRGAWAGKLAELSYDETDSSVLKLIKREEYYFGIAQTVHSKLEQHGLGKYRLTGKVKLKTATYDDVEYGNTATKSNLQVTLTLNKSANNVSGVDETIFAKNNINNYVTVAEDTWTEFSLDFDVSIRGTTDDGTDVLKEFPLDEELDSSLIFVTAGSNTTDDDDLRDMYLDDLKFTFVEEYSNPEKIGIAIENDEGVVYANEIAPEEEYGYKTALQLPEDTSINNLTAKVYNPSTKAVSTANVTTSNARNKTVLKTDKTVQVSFDIFDYVDTRDIDSLSIIAANYDANNMLINTVVTPLDITHSTLVNQNVTVGGNAKKTKLFLFENMTTIIPLSDADVFTSYEEAEPTLFLIGDSICVQYKPNSSGEEINYPQQGWGVKLTDMLEGIDVVNCAHGGYSTTTFLVYDRFANGWPNGHAWSSDTITTATKKDDDSDIGYHYENYRSTPAENILSQVKKGDYVLISLGINDGLNININWSESKPALADRTLYKQNLQKFIDDTKAKGAEIIFATPTANGSKDNTGVYDEDYKARGDLMVEVAADNNIVCLPLGAKQAESYNNMTEAEVRAMHMFKDTYTQLLRIEDNKKHNNDHVKDGSDDPVHLTEDGAQFIAELIAEMLASSDSSLKYYLK
ncbi:MAG: hypothetical protein E7404_07780 [Ruminococcaceae bacterium]|nr:hypothetical protein [Oscillospiraceae bacterium]